MLVDSQECAAVVNEQGVSFEIIPALLITLCLFVL